MTVLGIDISKWDGNWDAARSKAAGAAFVFIKASQGVTSDPLFAVNWQKAKDAGLLRGAYHYLDTALPGRDQADFFANLIASDRGEFPPVVDFEENSPGLTAARTSAQLRDFVNQLKSHGYTPTIYTSASYWQEYGDKNSDWAQYPLWLADYNNTLSPAAPAPWTRWTFWQYSTKESGETYGTESYGVDGNRYTGTVEELLAFAGINKEVAETADTLGMNQRLTSVEQRMTAVELRLSALGLTQPVSQSVSAPVSYATCSAQALNVRSGPGASYPVIGWLSSGQSVRVLERQNGWARLESPAGWSGERYLRFS